ncbi:MAG: hypothetical protein ACKVS9_10645, partial [Phycisphaerae bacterium]
MQRASALVTVFFCLCATGCAITPASKHRLSNAPSTRPTILWPAVETDDLDDLASIAPQMLHSRSLAYEMIDGQPRLGFRKFPEYKVHETARAGVGLIRVVSIIDPLARVADNTEITLE